MADAPNRPLSPHLQVYRPQITSVLSIMHRATGIVLSLGTVFLVLWLMAAASGPEAFELAQACAGSWLGYLFLFGFSVCLFYHLLNGIRHLFWDAGHGFELGTVTRTGWAVILGTIGLTAVAWVLGLTVTGAM
ncbi:MAG: succinate dehydrogenase, cytochrome b556 subunit [Alphaproteobacteria bacterium]|jgi:succinate dehydrogenase / fumarate reductase, cytochrome b subunit|nr:succinate dehydrogenase, cytochrome b556 subunit [Rhodospirillaceae bacterium]MDG2483322.1 succinate dehydrogenase, cytochrome b556 subunit [Alphaproteobacteria bacterium]MBT6206229.1 succinate dehydrogenase, cytochrome b556 subunit [Rhodospirillaceae bacterium]MBT6509230.1 succinate dehydrogenase, cytochrome b556 subunit [Rhodospirillaceae bacterium]MBT7615495.1 succinate dehydrogenase, cytochrome b556 subunit [Rhodospirillaceae bacterium]